MPALFTLPKQVVLSSAGVPLAGALVYFYATGTSTPQNTYQDEALTTPHANPVVADANGLLPVIYFDGSLPDYRVRVADSADVQQYQVDGIPSAQDAAQSFRITSAAPEIILDETGVDSANAKWRIRVNGEQLTVGVGNAAESAWVDVIAIDRTGTTVDSIALGDANTEINLGADVLRVNVGGTALLNGELLAIHQTGSYTGTLTGLTASPTTTTVQYRRAGSVVTLSFAGASGTSNSNALTVTGMPAAILPAAARQGIFVSVLENGTQQIGRVTVETSGNLTFSVGADSGVFTASGSKGVVASTITYPI